MGQTSHLSDAYDAFSSSCASFPLLLSPMTITLTRVMDQDGIRRPADRDVRTTPTHADVETMSEKLAYRKFIKDSEFETRELFERENIENIATRLETTRLDDQMTQ